MYHIWAANGQAHFINRQNIDDGRLKATLGNYRPELPVKLIATVLRGVRTVHQSRDAFTLEQVLYLVEAADDEAGLVCQCQCLQGPLRQLTFDQFREVFGYLNLAPQTPGEGARFNGGSNARSVRSDPYAAAGKLARYVRIYSVFGSNYKADQIFCGAFSAREGALTERAVPFCPFGVPMVWSSVCDHARLPLQLLIIPAILVGRAGIVGIRNLSLLLPAGENSLDFLGLRLGGSHGRGFGFRIGI